MKHNLPGPFTFILNGTNRLPKIFRNRKEVGIRMPDNNTSVKSPAYWCSYYDHHTAIR